MPKMKMSAPSMLQWQYRTMLGELSQVTLHSVDDSCPCNQVALDPPEYCLGKHLLTIWSLGLETALMDEPNADMLEDLASEALEHHEAAKTIYCKGGTWPDLATWSRNWRKKIEKIYYTCGTKMSQDNVTLHQPAPFGWVGGKRQLSKTIVPLIPPHKTYVEPFAGAASVFWAKQPSEVEVLNDLDPDLMRFYRDIGKIEKCNLAQTSKNWDRLKERQGKLEACEFLSEVLCSYGDSRGSKLQPTSTSVQATTCYRTNAPQFHRYLPEYQARLKQTKLHNEDWQAVILQYDALDTFFFLDPPYHGTSRGYKFGEDQLARLAETLPNLKGKWLLSYDNDPDVRQAFKSFHILPVTSRYTMQAGSNTTKGKQLLIANYPLETQAKLHQNAVKVKISGSCGAEMFNSCGGAEMKQKTTKLSYIERIVNHELCLGRLKRDDKAIASYAGLLHKEPLSELEELSRKTYGEAYDRNLEVTQAIYTGIGKPVPDYLKPTYLNSNAQLADPLLAEIARELCGIGMCLAYEGKKTLPVCSIAKGKKLERCILKVKKSGSEVNPFVVCQSMIGCSKPN